MTREYIEFLRRFFFDREFRSKHLEYRRLGNLPRYHKTTTNLLGKPIDIVDNYSFLGLYEEIFEDEIYRFETETAEPYIIDGGSNIGLSVIYFKKIFPKAKVVAFEPDKNLFSVLTQNMRSLGLNDVVAHECALWSEDTRLDFMAEGSDSGRIDESNSSNDVIKVKALRLKSFLDRKVDFLKLDIEGAEFRVLEDCRDVLKNVEKLFVEYHSFENQPQTIDKLLEILLSAGFRLSGSPIGDGKSPFYRRESFRGMDFQMNICAYR